MQRMIKTFGALGVVLALVCGTVALGVAPAGAGVGVVVREVDTTAFPKVELTVMRPAGSNPSNQIRVTDDGKQVNNLRSESIGQSGKAMGTIIVMDTSDAMNAGATLADTKAAVRELVNSAGPNEEFGVVTTNGGARPIVTLTSAPAPVIDGIDRLNAGGDSAVVRGVKIADDMLKQRPELLANIIVIAGGPDGLTQDGVASQIRSSLRTSSATFSAITLPGAAADASTYSAFAQASGGNLVQVKQPSEIDAAVQGIGKDLRSQSVVTFDATSKSAVDLRVTVAGSTAEARVAAGTVAVGAGVAPAATATSSIFNAIGGKVGLLLIGLVTFVGIALLVYAVAELVARERNKLSSALAAYSDEGTGDQKKDFSKLADSEIIKKAIASTARMAEQRGIIERLERKLEQADLHLKPAEALFITIALAGFMMFVGLVFGGILGLVGAGFIFGFLPIAILNFKAKQRSKRFTSQLPDTLQLLAGSMRAGYSLVQGIDAVAQQTSAPMSVELQRALSEARLGRPVEDALQDISDRVGSEDFEWTVMAIKIQREVGGNLAELLMTVSNTMIERERLRREVRALTAEGRISAVVLSALPPLVGGAIFVMNPAYMDPMINSFIGQVLLAAAGLMIVAGYFVMTKMMEIEA